jgi:lipopolysaccharide biosynthesis regulator YciM
MENGLLYLLIVAAIGCGWWLGRRQRKDTPPPSGPHYYAGLNYLLNEEPDRAVTRFIEDLGVNQDTIETHLALGSLLRRRGEVEKAVVIHQNILAHGALEDSVVGNVQLELARDYLLAGLLDRAEELLLELAQRHDLIAQEGLALLVEVYEREKEWYKAIAVSEKLAGGDDGARYDQAISHYYCEIAQVQLAARQIESAREALRDAIGHDAKNARTSLLLGQLELQQERFPEAVRALQRIKDQSPLYVPESLPDLLKAAELGGATPEQVQRYLRACLAQTPSISIVLTLASSIREASGDEAMAKFIANHLKRNPTIRGLTQLIDLHIDNTSGVAKQNLSILRSFAEALVADKPAYRCHECGFDGKKLHWHCPVCKGWGTIHAIFGLEGE